MKLMLDAGHGGADPGAIGNGLKEKDLTLKIVKYIKSMLEDYKGVEVMLTRSTDKTVSLKERTDMANSKGVDFFLSIHINAGGGEGYEDFIYSTVAPESKTADIQNKMHNEITKNIVMVDRGKKKKNLHVLRETKMPAMLTENGFIDNVKDSKQLQEEAFLITIAKGHVDGIVKSFSLKKKPVAGSEDILYQVVAGSFAHYDNAKNLSNSLKKKGIDTFIQAKPK